jgi:hypothetical protein
MSTPLDTKCSCEKFRVFALNTSFHRGVFLFSWLLGTERHMWRGTLVPTALEPLYVGPGMDLTDPRLHLSSSWQAVFFLSSAFSTKHSSKGHSRTPVVC